jgi:hypothetical protein
MEKTAIYGSLNMSEEQQFPLVSDADREDVAQRGAALYEALREKLEPEFDRKFVAIHVDSGDYEIARSTSEAMRAILARWPADGRLYMRKIGNEPEWGLAARILASEMRTAHAK